MISSYNCNSTSTTTTASVSTTTTVAATNATSSVCKCGIERTKRIVGGSEVKPKNKYPWMVALVDTNTTDGQFCGGTLVASKYIITAAHCMFKNGAALASSAFQA